MKKHVGLKSALLLSALLLSMRANAVTPAFTTLSQSDVDSIENDLSSNTTMHSVLPPSNLGSIWGFELGVAAGATKSPNINTQVHRVSSTTDVTVIPHASIVGAVAIPFGLQLEATYLPKTTMSDISLSQYALALKWNLTDTLLPIPLINLSARGFYAHSELSFNQTVNDVTNTPINVAVSNVTNVEGVQLLVGPKLPIIEPYAGIGYLSASGTLSNSNSVASGVSIFADGASSHSSSPTSSQLLLGFDVRLLILGAGVEYSRAFGTDSYTAKLSLKF